MALDDIKVTYPETIPERMSRVRNRKKYGQNFDAIFRKKTRRTYTKAEKKV